MLKALIVVLMVALVASLGSGFYYLMLDQGDKTRRRTFHSLGVRLTLAIALMSVIIYVNRPISGAGNDGAAPCSAEARRINPTPWAFFHRA